MGTAKSAIVALLVALFAVLSILPTMVSSFALWDGVPPQLSVGLVAAAFLLFSLGILAGRSLGSSPPSAAQKASSRAKKIMRTKVYPPTFPNGWYKLCDSDDLPPGSMKRLECCDQHLVVFRTENGEAKVLDAYCPHLGADLGVGGRVVGDCVECPFHKWTFDGEGKCTHIPYSKNIPSSAKTKSWPVVEYHNLVCFYYDAEGREPSYLPPRIKEIDEGSFVYRGKYDALVHMHIQEFAENSADFQHFDPLHGQMCFPYTLCPIPGFRIVHKADWIPGQGDQPHIAYFKDTAHLQFCGKDIPRTGAQGTVTYVGPGSICYFYFETELGNIQLFQTHTPVALLLQRVEFRWWADKKIPRILVWYVIGNWIAQWKNDIAIWENKVWTLKPLLVKEDGPVQKLRRWYAQFYSSRAAVEKNTLDW